MKPMLQALAADYEPILLSWIAPCDTETQALLRPAVDVALDAIERLCRVVYDSPAVIFEVPAGRRIERAGNYGPADIKPDEFVIFACSPEGGQWFARKTWPEPHPVPAGTPAQVNSAIWTAVYECIHGQRELFTLMRLLVARWGPEMTTQMRAKIDETPRKRFTPAIVALTAVTPVTSEGQAGCGVVSYLPLPATIKTHGKRK